MVPIQWKGVEVKFEVTILMAFALCLAGCKSTSQEPARPGEKTTAVGNKVLLTVDFQKDQMFEYKFVSTRETAIDWDPEKTSSRPGRDSINRQTESFEMVISYIPVEVDSYGLTTIQATCKSVKAMRGKGAGGRTPAPDAVQNLDGKTFTFTVAPSGRIQDYSQLDKLIREIGEKAFRTDTSRGRIKEPDMIGDFIASQWFLWDSISNIENPSKGIAVGQTWTSKLSVPTPMVLRKARDVTYKLAEIRQSARGNLAVIEESFRLADSAPQGWPVPYSGKFQVSGTFGFLGPYEVLDLQGRGEELFNIDTGRLEKYEQQYTIKIKASLPPLGIQANPQITIDQKFTMELLKP